MLMFWNTYIILISHVDSNIILTYIVLCLANLYIQMSANTNLLTTILKGLKYLIITIHPFSEQSILKSELSINICNNILLETVRDGLINLKNRFSIRET